MNKKTWQRFLGVMLALSVAVVGLPLQVSAGNERNDGLKGIDLSAQGIAEAQVTPDELVEYVSQQEIEEADADCAAEFGAYQDGAAAFSDAANTSVSQNTSVSWNSISSENTADTELGAEKAGYATIEEAAAYFRKKMVQRKQVMTVHLSDSFSGSESQVRARVTEILNDTFAYSEDGAPDEGDYLYYHIAYMRWAIKKSQSGGYTLRFAFFYRTTYEEEQEVTKKINEIVRELGLSSSSKSEYEKIRLIYDYIMDHVQYDTYHYELEQKTGQSYNYMYTTYAALTDGYAVCQAYATLFYRLCHTVGISTRVIPGNNTTHGWNIVKIGDYYYNVDATWDDSDIPTHIYFLKNNADFLGHVRDKEGLTAEFEAQFPTSPVSYLISPGGQADDSTGNQAQNSDSGNSTQTGALPSTEGNTVMTGFSALQKKNDKVLLSWDACSGAQRYLIYRKTTDSGYICVGSTEKTSYTNTVKANEAYCYQIYAMYGNSVVGYSRERQITTKTILPKAGTTVQIGTNKYKILTSTAKSKTVSYVGTTNKKVVFLTIPDTVWVDGISYKVTEIAGGALKGKTKLQGVSVGVNVTSIGSKAFYKDSKLTSIVIYSKKLKKVGKNAFSGIKAKAVINVPSSKLSSYNKLLKGKGQKSSVKIKK